MAGPAAPRFDPCRRRALACGLGAAGALAAGGARAGPGLLLREGESSLIRRAPTAADLYEPPVSVAAVRDLYSRMTVPVVVDGSPPLAFVVDTGANRSVLAADVASALGFELHPPELVHGTVGETMAPTIRASRVQMGELLQSDVSLCVLPRADLGCDGLLSADRLAGQRLEFDFALGCVRIAPGRRFHADPREVVLRSRPKAGQLSLVDADAGGVRVTAFIDSGAGATVGNLALMNARAQRAPGTRWTAAVISSVTGQTQPAEAALLPRLTLGDFTVTNLPVVYADIHPFRMWSLLDRPALLIGIDLLSRFSRVSLDYARREVRVRAPGWA